MNGWNSSSPLEFTSPKSSNLSSFSGRSFKLALIISPKFEPFSSVQCFRACVTFSSSQPEWRKKNMFIRTFCFQLNSRNTSKFLSHSYHLSVRLCSPMTKVLRPRSFLHHVIPLKILKSSVVFRHQTCWTLSSGKVAVLPSSTTLHLQFQKCQTKASFHAHVAFQ